MKYQMITLKYLIERGISAASKTVNRDRMAMNIDVFDFELTEKDLELIRTLDRKDTSFFLTGIRIKWRDSSITSENFKVIDDITLKNKFDNSIHEIENVIYRYN